MGEEGGEDHKEGHGEDSETVEHYEQVLVSFKEGYVQTRRIARDKLESLVAVAGEEDAGEYVMSVLMLYKGRVMEESGLTVSLDPYFLKWAVDKSTG